MPNLNIPRHISLSRYQAIYDSALEASRTGRPIGDTITGLLEDLRCTDYICSQWQITDDESGTTRLIGEIVQLLLNHRGDATDLCIMTALHGLFVHGRWRYCIQDENLCFAMVSTVIAASEDFFVTYTSPDIFGAITDVITLDEWPFPEHRHITKQMLSDGYVETLEALCNGAFGSAWWQLVDPWASRGSAIDMILITRPPLVNFPSRLSSPQLPDLADLTS